MEKDELKLEMNLTEIIAAFDNYLDFAKDTDEEYHDALLKVQVALDELRKINYDGCYSTKDMDDAYDKGFKDCETIIKHGKINWQE